MRHCDGSHYIHFDHPKAGCGKETASQTHTRLHGTRFRCNLKKSHPTRPVSKKPLLVTERMIDDDTQRFGQTDWHCWNEHCRVVSPAAAVLSENLLIEYITITMSVFTSSSGWQYCFFLGTDWEDWHWSRQHVVLWPLSRWAGFFTTFSQGHLCSEMYLFCLLVDYCISFPQAKSVSRIFEDNRDQNTFDLCEILHCLFK